MALVVPCHRVVGVSEIADRVSVGRGAEEGAAGGGEKRVEGVKGDCESS